VIAPGDHVGAAAQRAAFPPGFSQAPGLPPYPVVMTSSMTADAVARGADVLLVAGDLTSAALPDELTAARSNRPWH
jgi:Icc protein